MAPASSAFEFQTVSADISQFQEKCDFSEGSGTGYQFHVKNYPPTPWTGTVVDEVEQCRKGFYNFSHQQIQKPSHSKERESRVRDKSYRGGNGRDRKMRIRSLRGSPVFPSTGLSPPRESSSVPSTNVYVRSPCRSTFSPGGGDYTTSQRDDSGDEDAPSRFLSGCYFEPTRSFTDLCRLEPDSAVQLVSVTGMEAESEIGAGVGTGVSSTPSVSPTATSPRSTCPDTPAPLLSVALPRSETDTANHMPTDSSFSPFNHPSFETYSISNPYTASTSISTSISTSASGSPVRNPKTSLASFSFLSMGACSPTDRFEGNIHSGGNNTQYKHSTHSQSKSSTSTSTSIKSSPIRGKDTGASIFAATLSHSTFSPGFYRKSEDQFNVKSSSTANQLENNLSDIVSGFMKRMDVSLKKVLGVLEDSAIIQNLKLHCSQEDVSGEGSLNKECSESDRILDVVAALLNSVSLHTEVDGTAETASNNHFRHSEESEINSKEKIAVSAVEGQGRSCLSDTCTPCATPLMDLIKSYFKSFDVDGDGYLTVNDFNEVVGGNIDLYLTDNYGDEEDSDLVKIVADDAVRCKEASSGSESNRNRSSPSEMSYVDAKEKEEDDEDNGIGEERDRDEEEDGGEEKSSRLEIVHSGSSSSSSSKSNSASCLDPDMIITPTAVTTKATPRSSTASTTDAATSRHTIPPIHNPYPVAGLVSTDLSLKKVF